MIRRTLTAALKSRPISSVSRRWCSDDPYQSLFPELCELTPAEMKITAGHFHLIMQDAWQEGTYTWEFGKLDENIFDACGHKWMLDFSLVREPSIDEETHSITGGTYRVYVLTRLTPGHPIPIKSEVTLTDSSGGELKKSASFYTPLQQHPDSLINETFEILRVSCEADTAAYNLDVENLASMTVTVSVCPQIVPKLISKLNANMREMEQGRQPESA
eukprot:TRINITY_DN21191_c0_g1_i1.p1 TRINITY_DN21191_c0_g1~~TRINITY_DN21191_c0_g1_i1.p1  ORF type:complete len:217 (+),score=27.24 TRINITY_DN21191_c0_g1_i1:67-717(+)